MEIIKHTNLSSIKEKWKKFYNNNQSTTPLQSYELFEEHFKNSRNILKTYNEKLEIFEVIDKKQTKLIMPLIKKGGKYISADTLDYYDIIYDKNESDEKLLEAVVAVKQFINSKVWFNRVNENSKLYALLKNQNIEIINTVECAKIDIPDDYDTYYCSLSKSTRQNIRTAYNRLNKDFENINLELKITYGKLEKSLINKLKVLYLKRKQTKNKGLMSKIKCIVKRFYEPISKSCGSLDDSFTAVLYVNGQIASFMQGVSNKNKNNGTIIIPRLVLNDKFSWYSTGILLINETIKNLIENTKIHCLDLAIGNEKYKFVMGGISHYNYKFIY